MSLPKPDHHTTVVITGASSGIGSELARGLGRRGFSLLLVARRRERLDDLANEVGQEYSVAVEVLPLDLGDPKGRGKLRRARPRASSAPMPEEAPVMTTVVSVSGFGRLMVSPMYPSGRPDKRLAAFVEMLCIPG